MAVPVCFVRSANIRPLTIYADTGLALLNAASLQSHRKMTRIIKLSPIT
jgi:hypothetical protein